MYIHQERRKRDDKPNRQWAQIKSVSLKNDFLNCFYCYTLLKFWVFSIWTSLNSIVSLLLLMNFSNLESDWLFTDRKIIETFSYCSFYRFYLIFLHLLILPMFCPLFRFLFEGGDENCTLCPPQNAGFFSSANFRIFVLKSLVFMQFLAVFGNSNNNNRQILQIYPLPLPKTQMRTFFLLIER